MPLTPRLMTARSRDEAHRASTPLELFFDLCFVVAVAQAGGRLVHALAAGHPGEGILHYVMIFFGIWWAWMNFTWFASAYDIDDTLYRVVTLVQIAGVLVLAAGVPRAFDDADYRLVVAGYLVMRLALCSQWLRAALSETDPGARSTALRYAGGVALCQVGWVLALLVFDTGPVGYAAMAVAEMLVPWWAERPSPLPWHPGHIAERYGLFTLIVLGETVAAATVAVQESIDEHQALGELLPIAGGGLLIVFAAWWIYFAVPIHEYLASARNGFLWGYGHFLVFGSAAAIGAGMEVVVEQASGKAEISVRAASAAVTVPAAVFLLTVWLLHARHFKRTTAQQLTLPVSTLAVLASTFAGDRAVLVAGLVTALTVVVGVTLSRQGAAEAESAV
ncbi:low temperature requirement protein A [Streptomyces sp. NPDC050738]|uniref:low temperature requirement protein A n=1 Tax=Streptomyces sp. NPDC050738 TaxID=3154744 RepID=UPI0034329CCA